MFTTHVLKHPPVGGPYLRIENSIKALSRVSRLYIYSRVSQTGFGGVAGLQFYNGYCEGFYFSPSTAKWKAYLNFSARVVNFLSKRVIKKSLLPVDLNSQAVVETDGEYLLKIAESVKPDVIWLGYGNISYPLLKYIKSHSKYKVVLDTDSVWSRFILRGLEFAQDDLQRQEIEQMGRAKQEEESYGTLLADVTTAVSEVDAEYYRGLTRNHGQVHVFSNVVDHAAYELIPPQPCGFRKPCMYLAGSFGPHSPMENAARWIIGKVFPLVRQKIPQVHFYIVGTGSDRTLQNVRDPAITIVGAVPSVLPYLCHADVAVVPLRFESGTRFKILEAGACSIPVVSTTLGAEGIDVSHGKDILLADDPVTFAQSIITLIENPSLAANMGANLKRLVLKKYVISSLAEEGSRILQYLMQERKELG